MYANISINRLEELKNSGDAQKLSLVKNKVKIAEKTMIDKLGTGIYSSGTDPKSIIGLGSIVGTANTVGGIDQSAYSFWRGQVDSSTTTLSIAAMQALWNNCSIDADQPTVIVTTRTLFNSFYNLLQPQQRFVDSEMAKAGFTSLMFNGAPVLSDSHCSSGDMYMINENYLHLFVHQDEDMRFEPFQKPINQNVKVAKVYWTGALGSSNNRLHGKLDVLTG